MTRDKTRRLPRRTRGGPAHDAAGGGRSPIPDPVGDTPLKRALDKATNGHTDEPPIPELVEVKLLMHREARMLAPNGSFGITAGSNAAEPIMFVGDNGAWRPIFAEPGSKWQVGPKGSAPERKLWLPGQT